MTAIRTMLRLLLLNLSLLVLSHAEEPLPDRAKFHLFVLAGQSNMAGRGTVEEQDRTPHPRVLMLNKELKWVPAVDPLHWDNPIAGVGQGKTFGQIIAERNPEITVGLIPCAQGGSPISTWEPGGFHNQTNSHPWDDAIARLRAVEGQGTIQAILWHQGESDAKPELAPLYEAKLHDLIARFRAELKSPNLPFIAGQMGKFPDAPWSEWMTAVDAVHMRLPGKVPFTAFVTSEGLHHRGDKVHFDSTSYRELGRRYAAAYPISPRP